MSFNTVILAGRCHLPPVVQDSKMMITPTNAHPHSPGRPRQFSDEDAFHATTRVLHQHGATGLTLAAVARELGCTGQALNARFGSRTDLLIAYAAWASDQQMERFATVREAHASPLQALRARFMLPMAGREDELADGGAQRQMLTLAAEAAGDPRLGEAWAASGQRFRAAMSELISEAIDAGEIIETDPDQLTWTLFAALVGLAVIWEPRPDASLVDAVITMVDQILAPYLTGSTG
jgi:AcrR family transcriptional regulator